MQKSRRKEVVEEHSSEEEEEEQEEEQQEESPQEEEEEEQDEEQQQEVDENTKKTDVFRRELRTQIINSGNEADKNIDKLTKPGDKEIIRMFKKMKGMEKNIVHAREGALESALFEQLSKHSIQQLKAITLGKEWDPNDFLLKLDEKFGKQASTTPRLNSRDLEDVTFDIDWNSVGDTVSHIFKRTPTLTFMHGPLSTERKERKKKERTKRVRDEVTEEKQAEEYTEKTQEDATTKAVSKLYKNMKSDLKKRKGNEEPKLPLPDIVVDPKSFCHTIENIFYFSFLVKEGKVSLELGQDGQLKSEVLHDHADETKRNQSIMTLNLNMFHQLAQKTQAYKKNNASSSGGSGNNGEQQQ